MRQSISGWFEMEARGIWIIAFLVVSIFIMAVGALLPVDPTEAATIYHEFENARPYIFTVSAIFGNNLMHCLIMFTPFFGPIYATFIFFNTGVIIAMFAFAQKVSVSLLFAFLFSLPHTWLELFAYSLALSQSVFLALAIFKRHLKKEAERTCFIIAICTLILFLAAIVEVIL